MPEEQAHQPEQAKPAAESPMEFVGNLFTHLPERNPDEYERSYPSRGRLFWAGDQFLRPGLYLWTGTRHILVASRNLLLDRVQAADLEDRDRDLTAEDPTTHPVTKEDWAEQWEENHGK